MSCQCSTSSSPLDPLVTLAFSLISYEITLFYANPNLLIHSNAKTLNQIPSSSFYSPNSKSKKRAMELISHQARNPNTSTQLTPPSSSRYENQKRRDWNTFCQYLRNHRPPLSLPSCSGAHVLEFLRYLD
ncbi:unnamed protein product, partial [Thlaspi arvense]